MGAAIDWAALSAAEWARNNEDRELKRESGIVIPAFTTGQKLRAWIRFRGEPAIRLYETPAAAFTRWMAFVNNPEAQVCVLHEHEFGQAIFLLRAAIENFWYIGATYPDVSQGRTTPGSIWAGECRCAAWGGPCPPVE